MVFTLNDLFPEKEIKPVLYSTTAVAKMMQNPKLRGNIRFRSFLREQGILEGDYPAEQYLEKGYFEVQARGICYGKYWVPAIKITQKGVQFILNLEKQVNNENK